MRTYIKKFENESEYTAFVNSSGFVTPNVSAWEIESGETVVNFNGTKPDIEAPHEYVDLGLPSGTLWATENIKDANGNELFFAWGETQGYTSGQVGTDKNFTDSDYAFGPYDWSDETNYGITKYNEIDKKTVLDTTDDAAIVNWGSGWRMPTKEQFDELTANTTTAWTQVDGVNGLLCTSNANGNTLFFPAVGSAEDGEVGDVVNYGQYWSVSLRDDGAKYAWRLDFAIGYCGVSDSDRYYGYSVRPVKTKD